MIVEIDAADPRNYGANPGEQSERVDSWSPPQEPCNQSETDRDNEDANRGDSEREADARQHPCDKPAPAPLTGSAVHADTLRRPEGRSGTLFSRGASVAVMSEDSLRPSEFAAAFVDFMRAMHEAAEFPESPIVERLREHLGVEPGDLPVTSAGFVFADRPNLQLALDAVLPERELLGLPRRRWRWAEGSRDCCRDVTVGTARPRQGWNMPTWRLETAG